MKFTREQVIEMARQAGFYIECLNSIDGDEVVDGFGGILTEGLALICTIAADRALEAARH